VRFWDSREGCGQVGCVHIDASSPDNVVPVGGLCARPDGRYLVVGSFDGDMHILDRRQQKVLHSFEAHSDRVTRLSCQGDTILSCSFDGNCRLWQF
jgi:WD40 repeat protein